MSRRVVDELGRELFLPERIDRVVSLVPSLTEWLFALDLGERVVGVTDFCTRPDNGPAGELLRAKPRLRGTKNPNRERILELRPDLVIANREENRERDVLALVAAGCAVYVTDPRTVGGAINTLERLAALLGVAERAVARIAAMRVACALPLPATHRRVLVPIWRDPWMAVGGDTYADDLLATCGALNVARGLPGRYPRFELARVPTLRPDIVLLPSEPYAFTPADLPALTPYFDGPVHFVDGELLTWYGPRITTALETYSALLR